MVGIENLHRPGLTPACGLRRAKVGFRFPTIPFLYYEYKIRNISIFYSLEFYFSQRAGEGRKSLHRPGLTPAYGLRRAKVVFSAPSIPFCIYHLYKFRELSSFYLQNYFPFSRVAFDLSIQATKLFSTKDRRRKIYFYLFIA